MTLNHIDISKYEKFFASNYSKKKLKQKMKNPINYIDNKFVSVGDKILTSS